MKNVCEVCQRDFKTPSGVVRHITCANRTDQKHRDYSFTRLTMKKTGLSFEEAAKKVATLAPLSAEQLAFFEHLAANEL